MTGTGFTLLAWNDLGMHCMDGDFSVFSILPPYNNLHAQLVDSTNNKLVTQGVSLTYEAMADEDGSINSISSTKTNFWQYVKHFFGVEPAPDTGLTGVRTAGTTPQPMTYDATKKQFIAEGIPITPYDDSFRKNPLSDGQGGGEGRHRQADRPGARGFSGLGRDELRQLPRLQLHQHGGQACG